MKKLLLVALACVAILSTVRAQTGRIAHLSHGGNSAALAATQESQDNFGEYIPVFWADSARYVTPQVVLRYGQWNTRNIHPIHVAIDTLRLPEAMNAAAAYRYLCQNPYLLRRNNEPVKFLGFDSVSVPAAQPAAPARRPHRRKAAGAWLPTLPPGSTGTALLLAALAGAGWLLAGRRTVVPA